MNMSLLNVMAIHPIDISIDKYLHLDTNNYDVMIYSVYTKVVEQLTNTQILLFKDTPLA